MNGQAATHYSVLGLTPEATLGEIKAAYRERIEALRQLLHTSERPDEAQLDALREAIATLGDPQARAAYDAQLALMASVAQAASNVPPILPAVLPTLPSQPAVAAADAGQGRVENFSFEGSGGEYFRIWIVNLLLSILTLGIYSAWAKVRREQYFHRNLVLDGSGFDYHG